MNECCWAYVRQGWGLSFDWLVYSGSVLLRRQEPWLRPGRPNAEAWGYFKSAMWVLKNNWLVLSGIGFKYSYTGAPPRQRCPWHDSPQWGINGYKNYMAAMELAKQPDFEERLAASQIVVINTPVAMEGKS